MSTGYMN